ncbi:MAG TPA: DUF1127 domain-containing protein [Acetobacteraceae bacterium]|jgi:uncharacterized protein YjiS (DUF1127 family)|nr:DUF1127 domain-containing protein [Acetobacteraceae bacterium]
MRTMPASGPIPQSNTPDISSWLSGRVASLYRFASAWAARRRAAREAAMLYRLNDTELRDMGLVQADIAAIISATYRRD